jgi:hypothetical protein
MEGLGRGTFCSYRVSDQPKYLIASIYIVLKARYMKIVRFLFLLPTILLIIPAAYGASPSSASGTIVGSFPITGIRVAGENMIIQFNSSFVLTGTLSGTCTGVERDVIHNQTSRTFFGSCSFAGKVNGKSGTALLMYEGSGSLAVFGGTATARDGTAGLTGLSWQASWSAQVTGPNSAAGTYSGKVHFA